MSTLEHLVKWAEEDRTYTMANDPKPKPPQPNEEPNEKPGNPPGPGDTQR